MPKIKVKAVLFDLYGTLVDILTDEGNLRVYEMLSQFLSYCHISIDPGKLRQLYFENVDKQLRSSKEEHPDVDVLDIFKDILAKYSKVTVGSDLVFFTARLFRSLTRQRFALYPGAIEILSKLKKCYPLGLVSDAQWAYTDPEIDILGLKRYFKAIVLSSRYGFRKPQPRLFHVALETLGIIPSEAVYVGNDPYRDLQGARKAGLFVILLRSNELAYQGWQADAYINHLIELQNILLGQKVA